MQSNKNIYDSRHVKMVYFPNIYELLRVEIKTINWQGHRQITSKEVCCAVFSHPFMSDSLRPHGL